MNEELRSYFAIIDDPRTQCDVTYPLADILIVVLCAIFSGMKTLDEIVDYGDMKKEMLHNLFEIPKIPSRATIARVLAVIDADKVGKITLAFMKNKLGIKSDIIAFDGKTIRATQRDKHENPLHILTAYATESGVTLESLAVPEKTNEIPAMQEMVKNLNLHDRIVTADALNTQKKTVGLVVEQGGDYVLPLKENHKTFYEAVRFYLLDLILKGTDKEKEQQLDYDFTEEKNRNRTELREAWVLKSWEIFEESEGWEALKQLVVIRRTTTIKGKTTVGEWNFFISSLEEAPLRYIEVTRSHWKIESLHWWLDVVMGEDQTQFTSDNAQRTLNSLRKMVFALLKDYKLKTKSKKSLKGLMFQALMKDQVLLDFLAF